MKKQVLFLMTLILVLAACMASPAEPNPIEPAPVAPTVDQTDYVDDSDFHLLVETEGDIFIKRDGWTDYQPAPFGTMLRRGDLIQTASNGRAIVLCDDLTAQPTPVGEISGLESLCPTGEEQWLYREDAPIANTRGGGTDTNIPYIISPRKTKLLDPDPVLRWNPVEGVNTYTIQIQVDGEGVIWETESSDNKTVYNGPDLQPGVFYLLAIEADNGKTSKEYIPDLGFSLLEAKLAKRVQIGVGKIGALNLNQEAATFALAKLYVEYDLDSEAIILLEGLVETGSEEPAIMLALGNLYYEAQLLLLAEGYYREAERLAGDMGALEMQTEAQIGLGTAQMGRGMEEDAMGWFYKALSGYQSLGDLLKAEELQEYIDNPNK